MSHPVKERKLYESGVLSVSEAIHPQSHELIMLRTLRDTNSQDSDERCDNWFEAYDSYQSIITNYKHLPRVRSVNYDDDGQAYAMLEYVPSQTLDHRKRLTVQELAQLLEAVEHLHRKRFAHGTLLPHNILFTSSNKVVVYGAGEWKALKLPPPSLEQDVQALIQLVVEYAEGIDERIRYLRQAQVANVLQLRDALLGDVQVVKGGLSEKPIKGGLSEKPVKGGLSEKPEEPRKPEKAWDPNKPENKSEKAWDPNKRNASSNEKRGTEQGRPQAEQRSSQPSRSERAEERAASEQQVMEADQKTINLDSAKFGGFWRRTLSFSIDQLIFHVPLYYLFGEAAINLLFSFFFSWLYHALFEASKMQGTPGRRLLGMRVFDLKGQRISFGRAVGRYFARMLSFLTLGIGIVMTGFVARKRSLHDIIAGTVVVVGKSR